MLSVAIGRAVIARVGHSPLVVGVLVLLVTTWIAPISLAQSPGDVLAWGRNNEGQCGVPSL